MEFIERMIDEAGVYGMLNEACPDECETTGDMAAMLIQMFRDACMDDVADYWHGNCIAVGVIA